MVHRIGVPVMWTLLFLLIASPALYASSGDQVHIGQSITVGANEYAGDLVCIACSIRMAGTCGDMIAVGGNVWVEGEAKGDVVVVGGAIHVAEHAVVNGDVAVVGGTLWRNPNATVRGSVSSKSGIVLLIGAVLSIVLPILLIVALIMWLIDRSHQPGAVRP